MRIAINTLAVHQQAYGGGNYIRRLVGALAESDVENDYLLYVAGPGAHHFDALPERFRLRPTVANRALRLVWEQTRLPADLERRKAAVYHGPAFVCPVLKACPAVITIHDMTFFLLPQMHTPVKRHYFQRMIPGSVERSEVVIAVSESVKRDIVRLLGTPPEKIRVIYLAADARFRPAADPARTERLRERFASGRKVILFTGLIHPRKNLSALVRAFARLKELRREYRLVIAGGLGWSYRAVLDTVSQSGLGRDVHFTGFVPDEDMPALYNLADIFVYPSLYEGFGLPILEAMASGVPVITSNVSSMPEIAGDAALLVDPSREDDIGAAITRLAAGAGLRADLREKGLARARQFSWHKAARETLAVYQQAAGRSARP